MYYMNEQSFEGMPIQRPAFSKIRSNVRADIEMLRKKQGMNNLYGYDVHAQEARSTHCHVTQNKIHVHDQTSRTRTKCLFDLKEREVCASHLCAEKVNSTLSALQHFLRGMRKYNEYMLREGNVHSPHRLALSHRLTAKCLLDLQIHARCARRKEHFLQRLSEKANSTLTH